MCVCLDAMGSNSMADAADGQTDTQLHGGCGSRPVATGVVWLEYLPVGIEALPKSCPEFCRPGFAQILPRFCPPPPISASGAGQF